MKVSEMEDRAYQATCPTEGCAAQGVGFVRDDLFLLDEDVAECPECETPLKWAGQAWEDPTRSDFLHVVLDALKGWEHLVRTSGEFAPWEDYAGEEDDPKTTEDGYWATHAAAIAWATAELEGVSL